MSSDGALQGTGRVADRDSAAGQEPSEKAVVWQVGNPVRNFVEARTGNGSQLEREREFGNKTTAMYFNIHRNVVTFV